MLQTESTQLLPDNSQNNVYNGSDSTSKKQSAFRRSIKFIALGSIILLIFIVVGFGNWNNNNSGGISNSKWHI